MLILRCNIQISCKSGKIITFNYVEEITVNTSVGTLTDTAIVKVPRNMRYKGRRLNEFINRGDKIKISAGYEKRGSKYGLRTIFQGYITSIANDKVLVVKCQDPMFKLKHIQAKAGIFKNFQIKPYLQQCGVDIIIPEKISPLGTIKVDKDVSVAQFLDKLKEEYEFLKIFYYGDQLYCTTSIATLSEHIKEIKFSPEHNIIEDKLKYIYAEDVKICIKVVNIEKDFEKLEVIEPEDCTEDSEKNMRTHYVSGYATEAELREKAKEFLGEYKVDRLEGSFTAFGEPLVRKCDIVRLYDKERPERNDKRFTVESVKYMFSKEGYRQEITLRDKLNN